MRRGGKEVRFRSQAQRWQRVAQGWEGVTIFVVVVVVAAAFKGEIEQMNLKNPTKSIFYWRNMGETFHVDQDMGCVFGLP